MKTRLFAAVLAALPLLGAPLTAHADTAAPTPPPRPAHAGRGGGFPFRGGEAIYKGVCQGCHMPDAKGAVGAGAYPALANNPKLETAGYPIGVVIHGQKAMPPLGDMFSDQQIADVVSYVRTHFGNHYTDKVTAADVKAAR